MARRWRHCVIEGCERRAQLGQLVCKDHEGSAAGKTISWEVLRLEREVRSLVVAESQEERLAAAKRFRQRVQRGDFASLFSGKFREVIEEAGTKPGLSGEIGALRLAIVRLLMEEEDPTRMAIALSRVSNAVSRAMSTEQRLKDEKGAAELEIQELWKVFHRDRDRERERISQRWKIVEAEQARISERERIAEAERLQREIDGSSQERGWRPEAVDSGWGAENAELNRRDNGDARVKGPPTTRQEAYLARLREWDGESVE